MSLSVFIQCRLNSSRLPGKALLKLSDTTLLGMLINRSVNIGFDTYVLTSESRFDDLIEKESVLNSATGIYRGKLEDVQSRFLELSKKQKYKYIARVTADNPLSILELLPLMEQKMDKYNYDYCSIDMKHYPVGTNIEVFTKQILEESVIQDLSTYNKEHVTPWIIKNSKRGLVKGDLTKRKFNSFYNNQLTIDTLDDYYKVSSFINLCELKHELNWRDKDFALKCIDILINQKLKIEKSFKN